MEKAILLTEPKNHELDGFDRVYIGNEFCQNLLPPITLLKKRIEYIGSIRFSIVTPIITDYSIPRIKEIFNFLESNYDAPEIIVNDIGILNLLNKEYKTFDIALGRVISNNLIKNSMNMMINSEDALNFFTSLNVKRVEISNKGRDMTISLNPEEINRVKVSLYYPYLMLATTRRCIQAYSKFVASKDFEPIKCGIRCNKTFYRISHKYIKDNIFIIGNSDFIIRNDLPEVEHLVGVDRLVYLPENFFSI